MTWAAVLQIIAEECEPGCAARIEERARVELGGMRITINKRVTVTPAQVETAAPGKPEKAAKILGIHRTTAYRKLRQALIR